jgi:hypothetical protein
MSLVASLRDAILAARLETSSYGEQPALGTLFIPLSHVKALRLEVNIVIGGRGVGKTFWTAALLSPDLRSTVGSAIPELDGVEIRIGFGNRESVNEFPNADSFSLLLDKNYEPYDIWRAVILRWVAARNGAAIPDTNWVSTLTWLRQEPEQAAQIMQAVRDWRGLIIFDALDRTSTDWNRMDDIVRGLLRAILWLKSYPGLFAKAFLREDQAERTVFNFPDASKLLATKAELSWARHDLHGLLWQRLINAPGEHGALLRNLCEQASGVSLLQKGNIWIIPSELKRESEAQRRAFEAIAGPWMGKDKRRGVPYTWSVSHLADGRGQTSPRSFLAAIQQAAEDSRDRYPDYDIPVHYESIKRGIQKASEIRVSEVEEDYPWVPKVLSTLHGLNVPCEKSAVFDRWQEHFPSGSQSISSTRLPAQHSEQWDGVYLDLQRLGMVDTKKDGRVDMPDLYRVGFGLGRMGGVKSRN